MLANVHSRDLGSVIDRRRLLLGLAAASTGAATVAASSAAAAQSENPELLRLASELPPIVDRFKSAWSHQEKVRAHYRALWPLAPDEITEPGSHHHWNERGFEGGILIRKGEENARWVRSSYSFKYDIRQWKRVLNSKKLKEGPVYGMGRAEWEAELSRTQRQHALALAYEETTRAIQREANYEACWRATHAAADTLAVHIGAMMEQPDKTVEGLLIKVEALLAWDAGGDELRHFGFINGANKWHRQLAASVQRHAESGLRA